MRFRVSLPADARSPADGHRCTKGGRSRTRAAVARETRAGPKRDDDAEYGRPYERTRATVLTNGPR